MNHPVTLQQLYALLKNHPAVQKIEIDPRDKSGWRGQSNEIPSGLLSVFLATPEGVECEIGLLPPRPSDGYLDMTVFTAFAFTCHPSTLDWLKTHEERANMISVPDFYAWASANTTAVFGNHWGAGVMSRSYDSVEEIAEQVIAKAQRFYLSDESKRTLDYLRQWLSDLDKEGEVTK